MQKQIPTTVGVLIIVLVAGVAGASVLFLSQDVEEEVAREEETFVEEDEITTEDDSEPEEDEGVEEDSDVSDDEKTDLIDSLWLKLPQEIVMVNKRTVRFDADAIEPTSRTEFGEFPYVGYDVNMEEVEIKMEDRFFEPLPGECPLEYAKREIKRRLERKLDWGELDGPPTAYQYSASFYHAPERRVAVYIRGMNYLDDSVGGSELRVDFQAQSDEWQMVWAGYRLYCRRPDPHWRPVSSPCL